MNFYTFLPIFFFYHVNALNILYLRAIYRHLDWSNTVKTVFWLKKLLLFGSIFFYCLSNSSIILRDYLYVLILIHFPTTFMDFNLLSVISNILFLNRSLHSSPQWRQFVILPSIWRTHNHQHIMNLHNTDGSKAVLKTNQLSWNQNL